MVQKLVNAVHVFIHTTYVFFPACSYSLSRIYAFMHLRNLSVADDEHDAVSPLGRSRISNDDSNFPLRKTGTGDKAALCMHSHTVKS